MRQAPTIVSHDARSRDIGAIVAYIADRNAISAPSAADADVAIARLEGMSSDLRGCAILDPQGAALAASGELSSWGEVARELLAAADAAAGEPVSQAHVGVEDGEVFALRHDGWVIVAAAQRFALASLMFFDMRAALRELLHGPAVAGVGAPQAA